jgi:UDP-2,4-diacetamido-2,4,6-trideoxy-beta-L-altropyranose hydrolase
MRCLTLAEGLRSRGSRVTFVSREHDGHLLALIAERGFAVHALPAPADGWASIDRLVHGDWLGATIDEDAAQTLTALSQANEDFDWLIVDHYGVDERWERSLRSIARRVSVIDDLADRKHDCDLLLDQNLVADYEMRYAGLVPQRCTLLLGPTYALLQPLYAQLRANALPRDRVVKHILVFFGGSDVLGLTEKSVRAFLNLNLTDVFLHVVVVSDTQKNSALAELSEGHDNINLFSRLPSLAPLMARADLAIGGGGSSSWERLCMRLPALVVTLAENQRPMCEELHRFGLVRLLGDAGTISVESIQFALSELLSAPLHPDFDRPEITVDGEGAKRVLAFLDASI